MEIKILISTAILHKLPLIQCIFNKLISLILSPLKNAGKRNIICPPHSPKGSLSLLKQPYNVPLNNVRFILLCPTGPLYPQNPGAMAMLSWHTSRNVIF